MHAIVLPFSFIRVSVRPGAAPQAAGSVRFRVDCCCFLVSRHKARLLGISLLAQAADEWHDGQLSPVSVSFSKPLFRAHLKAVVWPSAPAPLQLHFPLDRLVSLCEPPPQVFPNARLPGTVQRKGLANTPQSTRISSSTRRPVALPAGLPKQGPQEP